MDPLILTSLGLAGGAMAWALAVGSKYGALASRVSSLEKHSEALEGRIVSRMDKLEGKIDLLLARHG